MVEFATDPAATDTFRRTPRWAVVAAYAVPAVVLPSAVWRFVGAVEGRFGDPLYPVLLSVVSLGLGLLTLGLVHSWGERIPGWVPGLGGRPIPVGAAVIPAAIGGLLLGALVGYAIYRLVDPLEVIHPDLVGVGPEAEDLRPLHERDPDMDREVRWAYGPLAAWPVLLLAVTSAYYRRRTGPVS